MPRSSPFAGVTDGPAADAVLIELGRPSRRALGCLGSTTVFLAVVALGALSYAVFGTPGPRVAAGGFRPVTGVIGVVFLVVACALVLVTVKVVRSTEGLAFDAAAVWWRADDVVVRVPWRDIAAARLVTPVKIRYLRTSTPHTTTVELWPADEATMRRYPALRDKVIAGETVPGLAMLRFAFRLPGTRFEPIVAGALHRFATTQFAAGTTPE